YGHADQPTKQQHTCRPAESDQGECKPLCYNHLSAGNAARKHHANGASAIFTANQCASQCCKQQYPHRAGIAARKGHRPWKGKEDDRGIVHSTTPADARADNDAEQRKQVDKGVQPEEDGQKLLAKCSPPCGKEVPERQAPGVCQPTAWCSTTRARRKLGNAGGHAWPPSAGWAPGGNIGAGPWAAPWPVTVRKYCSRLPS